MRPYLSALFLPSPVSDQPPFWRLPFLCHLEAREEVSIPDDDVVPFTAAAPHRHFPSSRTSRTKALLDYALVALVALAVLAVARERTFTCPSAAASAGAAVAAALLVKPTAALFLAAVPLLAAVRAPPAVWKEAAGRRCLIVFLACAGLPPLAWYSLHMSELESSVPHESSRCREGRDHTSSPGRAPGTYARGLYRLDFAPILVVALLPGCFGPSAAGGKPRPSGLGFVPAWLALTFLMPNKDYRYSTLPVLPGIVLLGAGGLLLLPRGRVRGGAAALALGVASLCYAASSMAPRPGPRGSSRSEAYSPTRTSCFTSPSTPSPTVRTGSRTRSWASLPAPCTSGLVPTLSWG